MEACRKSLGVWLFTAGVVLLLSGCGGGGGGGSSAPSALISGTAAAGTAVVGSISVYDSATPSQPAKTNIAIDGNGYYAVDVGGLTAPFLLEARGTVGATGPEITLYSAATAADVGGTINITPFTNLMVLNIAGGDVPHWRASGGLRSLTATQLNAQNNALHTVLAPALAAMSLSDTDLLRDTFSADHTGVDSFLDRVAVNAANPQAVTITHTEGGGTVTMDAQAGGAILSGPTTLDPGTSGTYTLSGTVAGLSGTGLVIQANGDNLAILANGSFTFSKQLTTGDSYFVSITAQPTLSSCSIDSGGAGTIGTANITSVAVACVLNPDGFTISGYIGPGSGNYLSGLDVPGEGVVLLNNGADPLRLYQYGSFTFPTANGATYNVTVGAQPVGASCSVTSGGSGTVMNASVSGVFVNCVPVYVNVPNVTGLTQQEATAAITAAGLAIGRLTLAYSPAVHAGAVASQTPAVSAPMTEYRGEHTATLLPSGQVLLTGGYPYYGTRDSAELYDPAANEFSALGATMTMARGDHTTTLLPSGHVLLTGGYDAHGVISNSAELYDPVAGTFTALSATMTTTRVGHTATLLPSGQVLLTGGGTYDGISNSAELYDPVAGTFTALSATMTAARSEHAATLLPGGKVLLTGGSDYFGSTNSAELYDPVTNTFTALSATMTVARGEHTATLLPIGQVLLTGGRGGEYSFNLGTAELYDPVANAFTTLGPTMTISRRSHTATLLPSGQVLLTGGKDEYNTERNTAELYDPVANTFISAGGSAVVAGSAVNLVISPSLRRQTFTALSATMTTARDGHTATLLPSSQVLLTGGTDFVYPLNTAELYDPVANTFTALSVPMTTAREGHAATLLPSGQVLLTGGSSDLGFGGNPVNSAELYDSVANTFTFLSATMTTARVAHTATLLPSGQVLLTGGVIYTFGTRSSLNSAELYDPVANTFTALSVTMATARGEHTATLLPSGQVLLTGGYTNDGVSNSAELYDPAAGTFTALSATMTTARGQHTATLLPSGQVLLTGGREGNYGDLNTAELYDPVTNTFTALSASMTTSGLGHTATMLLSPNNLVLITGGGGVDTQADAEVYNP